MIRNSDGIYECGPCRTKRVYGHFMDTLDAYHRHCGDCHQTFHMTRHHCGLCHHTFYTEPELLAHRTVIDNQVSCLPADQVKP